MDLELHERLRDENYEKADHLPDDRQAMTQEAMRLAYKFGAYWAMRAEEKGEPIPFRRMSIAEVERGDAKLSEPKGEIKIASDFSKPGFSPIINKATSPPSANNAPEAKPCLCSMVRERRESMGLSQIKLGEMVGSRNTISRLENGHSTTWDTFQRILNALHVHGTDERKDFERAFGEVARSGNPINKPTRLDRLVAPR